MKFSRLIEVIAFKKLHHKQKIHLNRKTFRHYFSLAWNISSQKSENSFYQVIYTAEVYF